MNAAGEIFKTYLKAIRVTFFPNMWYFYPPDGETVNF